MSEVLLDTTVLDDVAAREAGVAMHYAICSGDTRDILKYRNILGPLKRYGLDQEKAADNMVAGQNTPNLDRFLIQDTDGTYRGLATDYDAPLCKSLIPGPVKAVRSLSRAPYVYTAYNYAKPNLQAWVQDGYEYLLTPAYTELLQRRFNLLTNTALTRVGEAAPYQYETPWTIEALLRRGKMLRAQHAAHDAIVDAGFNRVMTGWLDDRERRGWQFLGASVLYTAPMEHRDTMPGKLRQLRTGKQAGEIRSDAIENDLNSRNPRTGFISNW